MVFVPDVADVVGSVGLILLLTGFILNAMKRLDSAGYPYHWLNFLGSGILGWYAWVKESWVFLPLEIVWAAVALVAIIRKATAKRAEADGRPA
ncbi:MAG TPA: hypothetical protein VNZ52_04350 [Candidatus Thermoplasmatota archaeon]|nr:hypothetical protein [Candidatus Thermoplasmatota archaeon]